MILQTVHQKKGFQIVWLFLKDFLKKQAGFFFVLKAESAQGTKIIVILVVPELDIILVNFDLRKRNSEEVIGSFVENVFFSVEDQLMEGFPSSSFLSESQKGTAVLGAYFAFSTLLGMEFPGFKGIERFFIAAGTVQKRDITKEKIISFGSHFRMVFHGFQPVFHRKSHLCG